MQIVENSFRSVILRKRISYRLLFPQNFLDGKKDYVPVLYLLHGLFGESKNWTDLTDISELIDNLSFAVATFDAGNSWYSNGIAGSRAGYESFFIDEFITRIENDYKLGGSRENRAIAGISMGGYGALKFALKYPSVFVWAGSMSGAFDAPKQTDSRPGPDWEILGESIKDVFGKTCESDVRTSNDLFQIISEIKNNDAEKLPEIYFDCGRDDSFIEVNRELFEKLKEKKIVCSFNETSGGHDWIYWNRQLKTILQLVENIFK